jgi:hypothetical protein
MATDSRIPESDPTNEEILTALKTIGISGGSLDVSRTVPGTGGEQLRWVFWIKNKYVYRDDTPNTPLPPTTA